ncbi:hypothetical protein MNBD_GAMMA09-3265 [hydrothermal vent metagenome]|uniref:Acyltransferase 3 domain-containing protein n=1 Tax=hydrothermal vent metagenome TaxID=652676 RepID=A0A3B0XUY4_9ZZZZ
MLENDALSNNKFQLDSLDGLRGFAVLFVFLSHTSNVGIYFLPGANFSGIGTFGVFLFFILSSFLLTYPFLIKKENAISKKYLFNYFLRRFFRIFPLYLVYLLLALFSTIIFKNIGNFNKPIGVPFPLNLTDFTQHILLQQGKGVTWSIMVEFRYYFILPFLGILFSILLKNKILPCLLTVIILSIISQYIWPDIDKIEKGLRLGVYFPIFLMGSLMAVIHYNWVQLNNDSKASMQKTIEIAGILCLLIIFFLTPSSISILAGYTVNAAEIHNHYILISMLWCIILFSSIHGKGLLRRFFESAALRYLGFISFSFYLFHIIGIRIVNHIPAVNESLHGPLILLVTILISHISYKLIEQPSSKISFK